RLYGLLFFLIACFCTRTASDQNIKVFSLDHDAGFLSHLISRQMDQQVGYKNNGIGFFLTDADIDYCAVFLCDNPMNRKRNGHPLVFLDAAVVMRIEIRKLCIFIKRILLYIETRGVNMRTQNTHTFPDRKSTRLNSSHVSISYAVFCSKKK